MCVCVCVCVLAASLSWYVIGSNWYGRVSALCSSISNVQFGSLAGGNVNSMHLPYLALSQALIVKY